MSAKAECRCGFPTSQGHGHVHPRPLVARCGGPAICHLCALEAARHANGLDRRRRAHRRGVVTVIEGQ